MSICSRCGTEAAPTDRFCKKCGQRFDVNDADFALAERAPLYVPAGGRGWTSGMSSGSDASDAVDATDTSVALGAVSPSRPSDGPSTPSSSGGGAADRLPATGSGSAAGTESSADAAVATATIPTLARLLVRPISSPDPADMHEYVLDGHDIAIGRSPSCDIRIEGDQLISRRHALLRYDGERYTIVDLGSSNGTFVNDMEITEAHPLAEGDRILLGEHELVYASGPASATATIAGAHLRELAPAKSPAPKTEPHPIVLPPTDVAPRLANGTGGDADLHEPDLAMPTIPKSDLAADEPALDAENADALPDEPLTVLAPAVSAGDLDAVRAEAAQFLSTIDALVQRADDAERRAEQWHAALGEVRDRLTGLINELQRISSDADSGEELTSLIRIVRQAAENPRHVDYMMQLSESASDILSVLEMRQARQTASADTLNALTTLRAWIYRLG